MSFAVREDLLPHPGDTIAGHYKIESLLGRGGMGAVFAAKHLRTERAVAIKWMLPQAATSAEAVSRFIAEARATARIEHPNVVQIYDFGESNGSPYLVMERLRGLSLREHLDTVGRMTPAEVVRVLVPAMHGVAEAHREAIIHRDIKPDNIFLCRGKDGAEREAKVLDFGISKLYESDGKSNLTGTGMMMGTPSYMSPEQLNAPKDAHANFDVYAFGVVFYEALTGRCPYQAEGIFQLVAQIMKAEVIPPSHLAPGIPPLLDHVVMRAMHRDMPMRFQTMHEAIDAFEQCRALLGDERSFSGLTPGPYQATMSMGTGPMVGQAMTPARAAPAMVGTPGGGIPLTHMTPGLGGLHKTAVLTPNPHAYPSDSGLYAPSGTSTPAATPHSAYGGEPKQKSRGLGLLALGTFAVVFGGATAAGVAFFLGGHRDDPIVDAPPPVPTTPLAEPDLEPTAVVGAAEPEPTHSSEPSVAAGPGSARAGDERPTVEPEPTVETEPTVEPGPRHVRARPLPPQPLPPPQPLVQPITSQPFSRPVPNTTRPSSQRGANGAMIIQ